MSDLKTNQNYNKIIFITKISLHDKDITITVTVGLINGRPVTVNN